MSINVSMEDLSAGRAVAMDQDPAVVTGAGTGTGDSNVAAGLSWKPNNPYPPPNTNIPGLWKDQEEQSQTQEVKDPADTRFKVLEVDLRSLFNRFDHKTHRYESRECIIRRGQEFTLQVKVDKLFKKGEDVIKLQYVIGDRPRESRGTMFVITPGDAIDVTSASAVIEYIDNTGGTSSIRMRASLPSDCVVGRFTLYVRLYNKEDAGTDKFTTYEVDEKITVLFNPWCKDDTVYMEDEEEKKEYVLSQYGYVYCGSSSSIVQRPWVFGQFDKDCLDAAIYLLNASMLPFEAYGNPVRVTRCISAMVNSNDGDNGILTGNWSGKYPGGTSPTAWNGSVRILEEYMRTKSAVKYGQCWVFSGVCTTVCRALGIPARSVTNYDSAHDSDASMTVDFHVDEQGEPIEGMDDSVWNFHVWNEGWFKRPELPEGNDGWQAFDATPQESSDSFMQCGPAPVTAIKAGNVFFGYDTKFIYGEVNGDAISWEVDKFGERKAVYVDNQYVGKCISTKAVGKRARLDLTNDYKYFEGSSRERAVALKVCQLSSRKKSLQDLYRVTEVKDVTMTFTGGLKPNMDAEFIFKATNKSIESRTVTANINILAKYYIGVNGGKIDKKKIEFKLGPFKEEEFKTTIKASDWLNKIDEDATLGVYVLGKVKETSQTYMYKDSYSAKKPQLQVTAPTYTAPVMKPFDVTIKFKNPLDVTITGASFLVEGAGIQNEKKIEFESEIKAGEEVTRTVTLMPRMTGEREIIASFHSRQLVGIYGSTDIEIIE